MSRLDLSQFKSLIIQNEFEKCKILLTKSLKDYPLHPELLFLRAYIQRKCGNFEDALHDLEAAYKNIAQKDSFKFEVLSQIGLTYNEMGQALFNNRQYHQAIKTFNESLRFRENDWGILINRGDCQIKLKNIKEGLRDFVRGFEIAGDLLEITLRIANAYYLLGLESFNNKRYKEAIEQFDKMITFRNNLAEYYLIRGKCYYEINDYKKAYEDFKESAEKDPKNEETRNYLNLIKKPGKFNQRQVLGLDSRI